MIQSPTTEEYTVTAIRDYLLSHNLYGKQRSLLNVLYKKGQLLAPAGLRASFHLANTKL